MILTLILAAMLLTAFSGVPGLWMKPGRAASQRLATLLHLAGCASGAAAALLVFAGRSQQALYSWPLPGGQISLAPDALSAFFLLPVFVVMGAGSVYGEGYWAERTHAASGGKLRFFYGWLTAGLTLVTVAGDAWSFLVGWEVVGLSAFFLVLTESDKPETTRAAWIYLIATHVATLVLFAMFGAMRQATGSWLLQESVAAGSPLVTPILTLALIAFGIKAGLMPFHVWLPEAHAAAPTHVSAVLSGVVLKMGVYGMVRILTLVPLTQSFGTVLLIAGITSGILGVVFALAQHDLKRLLAYHSIENIGIIFLGLGAGVLGRNETWGALAFAGALLHVWNHSLFKALLFFSAGSVVHATGTRSIDELGGLLRKLPATGLAFLVGSVAICGLPPLNGFVSEWLIYTGSFGAVTGGAQHSPSAAILAVPSLALIGALAVACFVKAFSVVFLGTPRSERAGRAHGEARSMKAAMALLAALCVAIGVWPPVAQGALSEAAAMLPGGAAAEAQVFALFAQLPIAALVTIALLALTMAAVAARARRIARNVTWDCGYAAPHRRMQYTASSFAAPLVGLFRWALHPDVHEPRDAALFPARESFASHVPDPMLDRLLVPGLSRGQRMLSLARWIQSGRIQVYIFYIIAALLILLAWGAL